ncbi:MAG: hypothetical protein QM802_23605 [Agriterribacter sp.]
MKKFSFLMLLVSGVLALNAQDSDKQPYLTKSLSSESVKKVQVETSGGSITVASGAADQSRIEVYIRGNGGITNNISKEEIQKRLDENYSLDISVSNNKLTAIAKQKSGNLNWKKSLSISFKIFVTEKVDTKLSTSGGSISLTDLSGVQDFSTSGGSLHVQHIRGTINGNTSGGSITLIDSNGDIDLATSGGSITSKASEGNMKLNTSGGSLNFESLKGKIDAGTSGGSIHGSNISGELIAHTSGGSIDLRDLMCSLETSTSGGHINVQIKELGKYTKIDNSGGNIELEIPGNVGMNIDLRGDKISANKINNFSGSQDKDSMNGTLNGGGAPVKVNAGSGRITLSLK